MAAAVSIDITGFDNEDIDRQFTLRSGDANSSLPYDLTGIDFEADIRDQDNRLVLRLTTDEGDNGIVIDNAAQGIFHLHIEVGAIRVVPKRALKYDLLLRSGETIRRLWGGKFTISTGVTVPGDG